MDFDPDSFIIVNPLETSPYAGSSELCALYPQYLRSYDDCDHGADDITAFGNPIDRGPGLIDQFLVSDPYNTVDKLDTSLFPQRSKGVRATVVQTSKPIAPHIARSNSAADKLAERPPFRASLRSGYSRTGVKPRRQQRKERPIAADEADEKRRMFLERNRVAANKCRKRKSEQVACLQEKEVALERENTWMKLQWAQIKYERDNLKNMVMMHASCNHPQLSSWSKDVEMISDVHAQQAVGILAMSQSRSATCPECNAPRGSTDPAQESQNAGSLDFNGLEQETIRVPSLSVMELSCNFKMQAPTQYVEVLW